MGYIIVTQFLPEIKAPTLFTDSHFSRSNRFISNRSVEYFLNKLRGDNLGCQRVGMDVIWGTNNPLLVDCTSSMAEFSGVLLLLLILTWPNIVLLKNSKQITRVIFFMSVNCSFVTLFMILFNDFRYT